MSKYFGTVRTPLTIEARGKSHTFYIRELGYLQFMEILQTSGEGLSGNRKGVAIMDEVVLASVEDKQGKPAYTRGEWKDEIEEVVGKVADAAMKAQGVNSDTQDEPLTAEEAEGNV